MPINIGKQYFYLDACAEFACSMIQMQQAELFFEYKRQEILLCKQFKTTQQFNNIPNSNQLI